MAQHAADDESAGTTGVRNPARGAPAAGTAARGGSRPRPETVVVNGSDVHVERANFELPLAEARSRYGGVDVPAVLGGALAGLGTAALLGGLASAVGLELAQGDSDTVVLSALATALVVLALSALVGGWVAGRVARFDGARNGLLAGLLMALLLALMGAAGAYSAADSGLPVALDGDRLTTAAIIAAVAGLVVSLLAGLLGGRVGTRWHRDVDDLIVGTRPGAVGNQATRSTTGTEGGTA